MHVAISIQDEAVLVLGLVERAGKWEGGELMATLLPGQSLGNVPYQQLRALGPGEHELPIGPEHFAAVAGQPTARAEQDDPEDSWGHYALLGLGSFFLAAAGYGLLWWVEAFGAEVRVWWWVAWLYEWGGKNAVAGLFAIIGVIFELAAVVRLLQKK